MPHLGGTEHADECPAATESYLINLGFSMNEEVDDGTLDSEEAEVNLSLDDVRDRIRRLVELRQAKDEAAAVDKKAKKELADFQAEFFDELERSPLKGSVKVDLGDGQTVQLVPKETYYGRILNEDDVLNYFDQRALADEYTKSDIRMGRVHELVREHIEQKKPLPPGLDFYAKRYFQVTFK